MAAELDQLIELRFLSRPNRLKLMRSAVRDIAVSMGFTRHDVDDIVLAVNEACMNVIQHAYQGKPDGEIRLGIYTTGKALVFRLRDEGACVVESKVCSRDLGDIRPGGLGVHFITNIMDETSFLKCSEGGNVFEMIKYIEPQR